MTSQTFLVVLIAILIALFLGFPAIWLMRKLKFVDVPGSVPHKCHRYPVPLAGGFVIFLATGISGLFFGAFSSATLRAVFISATIAFLFGLWDDIRNISLLWKFVGQILATSCLVWLGIQIHLFSQVSWLDFALTYLWMVGITNAFNFVDSIDGLATGLAILAGGFLMLMTSDSHQPELLAFCAGMVGASLGVFYFTALPAKFFLGNSGAQYIGFIMGAVAIAYNPKGSSMIQSWFLPILLMGVPIFDTVLVVYSRVRSGRSVFQAGLDHTYHRLVAYGMDVKRAIMTMHFAAILLGCVAFVSLLLPPIAANAIFIVILLVGLAGIFFLDRKRRSI
jgi:UDP-GlcNAc:undecaprenyl-phosphate GlcNAc-1-phosphate transferase